MLVSERIQLNWASVNAGKVHEAVYALLRAHHTTHGLAVVGWTRSPGHTYYSFYCLTVRSRNGQAEHLPEIYGQYALSIYQDRVGLPAWSAGAEQEHPEWRTRALSVDELAAWYEAHLDLHRFFEDHTFAIARWRQSNLGHDVARYLATWQVLSLLAGRYGAHVTTYGRSYYDQGVPAQERAAVAALACGRATEAVHFCLGMAFCQEGRVLLPAGRQVDIWQQYVQRGRPEEIVDHLIAEMLKR